MRITYDVLTNGRLHPLGREAVRAGLDIVARDTGSSFERVKSIHFGWNARTTQEARIIQRGASFDIRVNFTVDGSQSRMLSAKRQWTEPLQLCGGLLDPEAKLVNWPSGTAAIYCWFILLHELGHVVYADKHFEGSFGGSKSSATEEAFCEAFALAGIRRYGVSATQPAVAEAVAGRARKR